MFHHSALKKIEILSYLLAAAMGVSSWGGVFLAGTYAKETSAWAAQGMGQDMVNLIFVIPLLLVSAFFASRGWKVFSLVLAGLFLHSIYSYLLYGFCVHFNRLFFFYCAALGLSFYGLILLAAELPADRVQYWFNPAIPTLLPSAYFMVLTGVFYLLWLAEDVPAVATGSVPRSLLETGLLTNPVHVLDLSIILPAMFFASHQLLRKKPLGYVLFPVMMVFSITMGIAIVGMMVAMKDKGLGGDSAPAALFGLAVLLSAGVLGNFLKTMKHRD
jgi:hypothetical protein